jgi:hypothetical protein
MTTLPTPLHHLRTESTIKYGLIGFLTGIVGIGLLFVFWPVGLLLLPLSVSLFLSRQTTAIDLRARILVITSYPFFFPIRKTISLQNYTTIELVYENSVKHRNFMGFSPNPDVTKYFELQLQGPQGPPFCLLEFPDYAPAVQLARQLAQALQLPLEDKYGSLMASAQERRKHKRR